MMKIKISNIKPFDMIASYCECTTEQVVQDAYVLMLKIGFLSVEHSLLIKNLGNQRTPINPTTIGIDLTEKQQAQLDTIMVNKPMEEINGKAFDLTLSFHCLTEEVQAKINQLTSEE